MILKIETLPLACIKFMTYTWSLIGLIIALVSDRLTVMDLYQTCSELFTSLNTMCFTSSYFRNRAAVSLFWDIWCPQRPLCEPKTECKFSLVRKHSLIQFNNDAMTFNIVVVCTECCQYDVCLQNPVAVLEIFTLDNHLN